MGRLIDCDKLCTDLLERWNIADKNREDQIRWLMADVVTPIVVSQPTVDTVEVVRCRNCKHNCDCEIQYNAQAGELFYCGAAERKDGGHETD